MKTLSPLLGLAIVVASLTGCNASLATSTTTGLTTNQADTTGDGDLIFGPGAQAGGGMPGGMGGPGGGLSQYLADLDLTADQQTQIDAVDAQAQPGAGQAPPSAPSAGTDLVAVLTADTLDVAALRTALTQASAMPAGMGGDRQVSTAEAYYAILTAAQRAALATQLEAATSAQPAGMPAGGQPPAGGPGSLDVTALQLTSLQQAAWDAYQAKAGTAQAAPRDPGAQNAALAAYFKSGDADALEAAFADGASTSFPIDEFIAFAGSLSAEQRQTAFADGVPGLFGGPGGPGIGPQG
jgi:Spy/CpxP family protein refolding chaperone